MEFRQAWVVCRHRLHCHVCGWNKGAGTEPRHQAWHTQLSGPWSNRLLPHLVKLTTLILSPGKLASSRSRNRGRYLACGA